MGPDQVAAVLPLLPCAPVAVLGVRPFGLCRDQAALEHWCQECNVPLIIDAAAALGGVLPDGRPVGGQGAMETFSLHATKVFAIGEGGAIAYMPQWQTPLREVLNFGMHNGTPTRMGINGKLSEFPLPSVLPRTTFSTNICAYAAQWRSATEGFLWNTGPIGPRLGIPAVPRGRRILSWRPPRKYFSEHCRPQPRGEYNCAVTIIRHCTRARSVRPTHQGRCRSVPICLRGCCAFRCIQTCPGKTISR